jgi:hypothetical protein
MAVPFSLAMGASGVALLLDVDWLGFAGWQWLFILEGIPAVILGRDAALYDRLTAPGEVVVKPSATTSRVARG